MFFDIALKTKAKLDDLFGENYKYQIWYKNGGHDVEVNYNDILNKYKYYDKNDKFWIE